MIPESAAPLPGFSQILIRGAASRGTDPGRRKMRENGANSLDEIPFCDL